MEKFTGRKAFSELHCTCICMQCAREERSDQLFIWFFIAPRARHYKQFQKRKGIERREEREKEKKGREGIELRLNVPLDT